MFQKMTLQMCKVLIDKKKPKAVSKVYYLKSLDGFNHVVEALKVIHSSQVTQRLYIKIY